MIKIIENNIDKEIAKIKAKMTFNIDDVREDAVREIIRNVSKNGDRALLDYTKKYDGVSLKAENIAVSDKEINEAYDLVDKKFIGALKLAIKNIEFYHKQQLPDQWFETKEDDIVLGLRNIVMDSVGVYVPGGRFPYSSSVLMGVIPAKIAGVKSIAIVTPPNKEGKIDPHILVAAKESGATAIYRVGGAQAIAALAFGTDTIRKVDKIVGPGNIYVTLAKKLVYGMVGIDKLAGPSEAVIIADGDAEPKFVAADMLIQAEHDPHAVTILITNSRKIVDNTLAEIKLQMNKIDGINRKIIEESLSANGAIFVVKELKKAQDMVNEIAPEHLSLMIDSPHLFLEGIRNAGAVFLGPYSPQSVGDYIAGPNHILPTGGSARFSSPLGIYDFIKKQSIIGYTKNGLKRIEKELLILTKVEGLTAHGEAVKIRLE
ncbi:MAG: histidinol dehydrogenase [bacterium]